ncbi:MAG: class I SAM-dependent methyltransferase [Sedimentisphaerales bacterium]|nr:class I SAM-dependent methyltransferase [Sedimentisphaerales bacterium]
MAEAVVNLKDIAGTSLVTLYSHALETASANPILSDPQAVAITEKLGPYLAASPTRMHRRLAAGKVGKRLAFYICLRARRFDQYVQSFLREHPDGAVVNIGCGFDTRFSRCDNGRAHFYDLDFPEVIEAKKLLVEESPRYRMVSSCALDHGWMDQIAEHPGKGVLFTAEGVFIYLQTEQVRTLVLGLQSRFPGCELVCEVFNSIWQKWYFKWAVNLKLRYILGLGKGAKFSFGIRHSTEMEQWGAGIEFLDDWSYFDDDEIRYGWHGLFRNVELFRKTQWTVRYKLH